MQWQRRGGRGWLSFWASLDFMASQVAMMEPCGLVRGAKARGCYGPGAALEQTPAPLRPSPWHGPLQ